MSQPGKLCMCCMNAVPQDSRECPSCGFNGTHKNPESFLRIGCRIAGRYVVGGVFSTDSESVTYNCYDISASQKVLLTEFLPAHGCVRADDGITLIPKSGAEQHFKTSLGDFRALYFALSLIDDAPSLIKVYDFFDANNTAYAVIEYFAGVPLKDFLRLGGGAVRYDQCESVLTPVLAAAETLHSKGLVHKGISPSTIFVNRNGDVKLGGFATSAVRSKGSEVAPNLFVGYAAPEQYSTVSPKTPATDVYSIAAVIYRCLTGITPQESEHRRSYDTLQPAVEYDPTIPLHVSRALELAMLLNETERLQTVDELRHLLDNAENAKRVLMEEAEAIEDLEPELNEDFEETDDFADGGDRREKIVRFIMFASVAFFCISLAAFAIYALLPSPNTSSPGDNSGYNQMYVPDYVGEVLSDSLIADSKFVYEIVYESGNDAEPNEIIRQYPLNGAKYDKGDVITLYVNRYFEIGMVKLVGLTVDEALEAVENAGIINYRVEQQVSESDANDVVIGQSIKAGDRFNIYSEELIITVSVKLDMPQNEQ